MISISYLAPDTVQVDLDGLIAIDDLDHLQRKLRAAGETTADTGAGVNVLLLLNGAADLSAALLPDGRTAEAILWPLLARVRRLAVVSERHWPSVLLRSAAPALPALEARVFAPAELPAARDFAFGQLDETGDAAPPALRMLDSGHPDLIAYEIDGTLHQADAERLLHLFERALDRDRPVSLLVRITHYGGFDPSMMLSGPLWTMRLASYGNLHRYALVGADPWMQSMAQFANPLTRIDMKCFPRSAEDEAWDWVRDGLGGDA